MSRLKHPAPDKQEKLQSFRFPLSGKKLPYRLYMSPRARYARVEIRPETGIRVILPRFSSPQQAEELLADREKWILKHLSQMQTQPDPRPIGHGSHILYHGVPHTLSFQRHSKAHFEVQLKGKTIEIRVPQTEKIPLADILESWFRWQAKIQIGQLVQQLARRFNLKPGRITIRDQKTRWGSCSARGNLNFNWRLLMAPPEVLRYVIIHELTHIDHPNHSKKFWARVAQRCPDYRKHENWLKENRRELRRIQRSKNTGETK